VKSLHLIKRYHITKTFLTGTETDQQPKHIMPLAPMVQEGIKIQTT